jgi:hypothetical protein
MFSCHAFLQSCNILDINMFLCMLWLWEIEAGSKVDFHCPQVGEVGTEGVSEKGVCGLSARCEEGGEKPSLGES